MSKTVIRELVTGYVENLKDTIRSVIIELYNINDTCKAEDTAYKLLTELLGKEGFSITQNPANIHNSFIAKFGDSAPTISYICEYDAVDGLGYINGHNIQCTMNTILCNWT